jgi:acetyltransferase-like isoleucine patch superfamily enzyme
VDGHRPRPLSSKIVGHLARSLQDEAASAALRVRALANSAYICGTARLRYAERIACGRASQVHHGAVLCGRTTRSGPGLVLRRYAIVREYAYVDAHGGYIDLGEGSFVGQGCVLYGQGGLQIGANTLLGPHVCISAARHTFARTDTPIKFQREEYRGVRVGDDVWIGAQATLLDGVTVGRGAVVGAGAVVTHDVAQGAIVAGVPARVIGWRGDPPAGDPGADGDVSGAAKGGPHECRECR